MTLLKISNLLSELTLSPEQTDELLEIYYQHRRLLERDDQIIELQKDIIILKLWTFLQFYVNQNSPDMHNSKLSKIELSIIKETEESLNRLGFTSIL